MNTQMISQQSGLTADTEKVSVSGEKSTPAATFRKPKPDQVSTQFSEGRGR